MFVLSLVCDLKTIQVDYTNAFAQATLNEEIYIEIPKGFQVAKTDQDRVLRLRKSLYGSVQAPKTFYDHLSTNLIKHDFACCKHIGCCFWINKLLGNYICYLG